MSEPSSQALEGIRVLEVAGSMSAYVGRLMAGMGADVILIEPPEGNAQRRLGPYIGNTPGVERSLTNNYYNAGKRSVTIDLDTPEGQSLFKKMAEKANLVIDSEPAGVMKARGLDYESLKKVN